MNVPIEAFAFAEAGDVPAGSFFHLDGTWYFAVTGPNADSSSAISLTGDTRGTFVPYVYGYAMFARAPYQVQVAVEDPLSYSITGRLSGSIVLGNYPLIFTQHFQHPRMFTLAGQPDDGDGVAPDRRRYQKWDGWLLDPTGRRIGDAPIFSVDVSKVD